MKISIITTSYNSAKTIRDTLESVHNQTYDNIEHVIIDGKSTDDTLSIVKEFPNIEKVVSEKDEGVYDAMNKGIAIVTGDIVGILNSDDFYENKHIIENVARLFEDKEVEALYGDLYYVKPNNIKKPIRYWKAGPYNKNKFGNGWMPPHPTFFVRKSLYEKYGNFDTRFETSADYELMLRFLFKNDVKTAYLPEVMVKMRTGGLSNSSLKHRLKANREDRLAWKLNGIKPKFYMRWLKPLRKIFQFRLC